MANRAHDDRQGRHDDRQGRDAADASRGPVDDGRPALPAGDEHPALAAGDDPPILAAEVVVSRGRPAECTIYPFDAPDFELVTQWITAGEGSFVSLDEMR